MVDVTGVCPTTQHEAIKLDTARWSTLPFLAVQPVDYGDGEVEHFEVRNCTCGSTLYRSVTP